MRRNNKNCKKALRHSKEKTKKLGKTSIYNIIHNTPQLSFFEKVDYIRHHYTSYESTQGMFHDSNGKPNELKDKLNSKIKGIVSGHFAPNELDAWNNEMQEWKNNQKTTYEIPGVIQTAKLEKFGKRMSIETKARWEVEAKNNPTATPFVGLIERYIASEDCVFSSNDLKNTPYKLLKELSMEWNRSRYTKEMN